MTAAQIGLASRSPQRRALLDQIGLRYSVLDVEVDETWGRGEPADEYVRRLAHQKAHAGWLGGGWRRGLPVLGADTAVVVDGCVLGKPRGREEAMGMLERLSGREHEVMTGVAVVAEEAHARLSVTRVRLRVLSVAERLAYWQSGEPADKAGAYAIQGLGAVFVDRIEGSFSGVVGLPLYETADLLAAFGIEVLRMR